MTPSEVCGSVLCPPRTLPALHRVAPRARLLPSSGRGGLHSDHLSDGCEPTHRTRIAAVRRQRRGRGYGPGEAVHACGGAAWVVN